METTEPVINFTEPKDNIYCVEVFKCDATQRLFEEIRMRDLHRVNRTARSDVCRKTEMDSLL